MDFTMFHCLFCIFYLVHFSLQEEPVKKKAGKKDLGNSAAIEELKKQVEEIQQELSLLKEQQALQTVCLRGTKIPGKCFLADANKKHYHAASEDCISKGGIISTPLTGEENDRLHDYIRQSLGLEEQVWLGVNDMAAEGEWVDQMGASLRFKNWESEITHQPAGERAHNCAVLSTTSNGKWFDENCRAEMAFVCEFNIV